VPFGEMKSSSHIIVTPAPGITPEQARDTRSRAWAYVFECWDAKKGDSHDLTNGSTAEIATNGSRKSEREKT
jgi:hypothetical protein